MPREFIFDGTGWFPVFSATTGEEVHMVNKSFGLFDKGKCESEQHQLQKATTLLF